MYQPRVGERVWVCPTNPTEPVQRAADMHGQFLTPSWQECVWDDFLNARLHDGSIHVKNDLSPPAPAVVEAPPAPSPKEKTKSSRSDTESK